MTGIYKVPVDTPVRLDRYGLRGDTIADTRHHGGPDQAIYIYGTLDYEWWSDKLGRELLPGTFGENLTVDGLASAAFSVGDRLHVGAATVEVTAPRIPCATLAARMGDPTFVKKFRDAERPGLYCRVIQEADVQAGDDVRVEPYRHETITIVEMFRYFYKRELSEEVLRQHLAAPIAVRDRVQREQELQQLLAAGGNV
jgi:MOSC domain-containing protein YiiM